MARRNKLMKFAEMLTFPNVFENFNLQDPKLVGINDEVVDYKGVWSKEFFKNENPLVLELACGGGEYALDMGRTYPHKNFIGIDVKGARIWKGAKQALEENLKNVAFVRTRIEQIAHFFATDEVHEIWVTFPDPFSRESKANRRLTSQKFLDEYAKIMIPNGILHLKTDDTGLYEFTLETLNQSSNFSLITHNADIYQGELPIPELEIQTKYEKMHLLDGRKIKWVQAQFKKNLLF